MFAFAHHQSAQKQHRNQLRQKGATASLDRHRLLPLRILGCGRLLRRTAWDHLGLRCTTLTG